MLKRLSILLSALLLLLAFSPESSAQSRNVKGKVLDETDTPVAGAFVTVKGETRGAESQERRKRRDLQATVLEMAQERGPEKPSRGPFSH